MNMNLEYEVYAIEGGFGYRILNDGLVVIDQPFNPNMQGFVRFTESEANDKALAYIVGFKIPDKAEVIVEKTPEQLRIDQLEADNVALMLAITDLYETLGGGV
jgi:hypothetical protein